MRRDTIKNLFNRQRQWFCIYVSLSLVYCSIFVTFQYLPLQDYPNHLLEARVIAHPELFTPYYQVSWRPAPNCAGQLLLSGMSQLVDIKIAGRLFFILYFLLFGTGAHRFASTIMHHHYRAGLVFFLFMTGFFFWHGYMNYCLSVSLLLHCMAWTYNHPNTNTRPALARDFLCMAILYFTHALTAVVFMIYRLTFAYRKKEHSWWYGPALITPPGLFAGFCVLNSSIGHFSWHYGPGWWKITSFKNLIATPYVSCLDNTFLFTLINLYNLFIYLGIAALFVIIALRFFSIPLFRNDHGSWGIFVVCLATIYGALPNRIGENIIDNRISYFVLLFLTLGAVDYLLMQNTRNRKLFLYLIIFLISGNFYLIYAQCKVTRPYLHETVTQLKRSPLPRTEKVSVPRTNHISSLARTNAVFRALSKVKLQTRETQITCADEHIDSYFYMEGGFPRKLFTGCLIRLNRDHVQAKGIDEN